ncbi:unnamed protein product [Triticum turgidum subsp. durum]|uniref:BHLH domain-containing protein n=1 Tax=Triticum turgidum subsp. durum TaxID=4567 RepID=A0A9R0TRF0_TRITD|nr:unnamed protein product [Triticum turgidum subsp. durum]
MERCTTSMPGITRIQGPPRFSPYSAFFLKVQLAMKWGMPAVEFLFVVRKTPSYPVILSHSILAASINFVMHIVSIQCNYDTIRSEHCDHQNKQNIPELAVRVDAKGGSCSGSGTDQLPNTPKSKHSATEQRRRSKINDRFQILRDLLPHTDQKRDKATFLLEVIEYIRFLQEKAQKYEASFPEWNQENAKLLPWSNMYFRSSWKNAQSKGQIAEDASPDPSQFIRNGASPGFNITGKLDDNHTAVASAAISGAPDQAETDHMASVSCRSADTPTNIMNNVLPQSQPQWADPSGVDDCAVNSGVLNNQQLMIDEGTISVSSQYSQELLNTLTHALQSSGIDLSQANISVQINLGKRAVKRPTAGQSSSFKEHTDLGPTNNMMGHQQAMLGNATEELPHATKRYKPGNT